MIVGRWLTCVCNRGDRHLHPGLSMAVIGQRGVILDCVIYFWSLGCFWRESQTGHGKATFTLRGVLGVKHQKQLPLMRQPVPGKVAQPNLAKTPMFPLWSRYKTTWMALLYSSGATGQHRTIVMVVMTLLLQHQSAIVTKTMTLVPCAPPTTAWLMTLSVERKVVQISELLAWIFVTWHRSVCHGCEWM